MDIAKQMRQVEKQAMDTFGEQIERERNGRILPLVGRRNRETRTYQLSHNADVLVGDTLRSVASGDTFMVVDIDKRVTGSEVIGITAHCETPNQQTQRLTAERAQPLTISIGSVEGSILNLTSHLSNVTQSIAALPQTSADDKEALGQLMQQLGEALRTVPIEHAEDAETVSERAESMAKEAKKAKPDQSYLTISAEGLKKAAANLLAVAPVVLDIATQIADRLLTAGIR